MLSHRPSLPLLTLVLLAACKPPAADEARRAATDGRHGDAAELYLEAAKTVQCPDRGRFLLARAEMLELDGQVRSAERSIDKAIELCPDWVDGYWARAQRAHRAGDRARAMEDAGRVKGAIPEAAELYSDLAMEVELERAVQQRANQLVGQIAAGFDLEAQITPIAGAAPVTLARQVPVPVTLRYQVQQSVRGDAKFDLKWEEIWSYRGEANSPTHHLVRTLELPPLDRALPMPVRLLMANQRLPMRFLIDDRGAVVEADWLSKGPDRGMRPEMLRPEVEGRLKRRRIYDPGEDGRRAPGDTWRGEDVRVVDGKARTVGYQAKAIGLESVRGITTLRIATVFESDFLIGTEELWVHPESAVLVRVVRKVQYAVESDMSTQRWTDHTESILIAIDGGG